MKRWVWVFLAGCAPQAASPAIPVSVVCPAGARYDDEGGCVAVEAEPDTSAESDSDTARRASEQEVTALSWTYRDPRATRAHLRPRALLITEITNIERLHASMGKNALDRPRLMRRLAETYVELEATARRDELEAAAHGESLRATDPGAAASEDEAARKSAKIAKASQKQAIEHYEKLRLEYPKWCQYPANQPKAKGCVDEVLYYLGLEYERAGDPAKARAMYLELVENWKQSSFLPLAYVGFGEMFYGEASLGDRARWPLAGNSYAEVLKYDPPANAAWGFAALRLAQTRAAVGEIGEARNHAKDAIDWAAKYPAAPRAKDVAAMARALRASW